MPTAGLCNSTFPGHHSTASVYWVVFGLKTFLLPLQVQSMIYTLFPTKITVFSITNVRQKLRQENFIFLFHELKNVYRPQN